MMTVDQVLNQVRFEQLGNDMKITKEKTELIHKRVQELINVDDLIKGRIREITWDNDMLKRDMKKAKRDIKILQFTNFVMLVAFLVWFMMEGVNL